MCLRHDHDPCVLCKEIVILHASVNKVKSDTKLYNAAVIIGDDHEN